MRHAPPAIVVVIVIAIGILLAPHPAHAAPGEIQGTIPPSGGIAPVVWGGGTVEQLVTAADAKGCATTSAWVFVNGSAIGYVVGAPSFVTAAFTAQYPGDIPDGTILLLRCASPSTAGPAAAAFDVGVNMPWYNWACDFGCSTGVAHTSDAIAARLATVPGITTVRWWMFEGPAQQITRSPDGTPTGIDPSVYPDIDAALALASRFHIRYDFVLFSAPDALPQSWFTDAAQRTALANVLGQLFTRYADDSRIYAWEAFNEPEWDYWNRGYAQQPIVDLTTAIDASIHGHSTRLATVGSAMVDGLPDWAGAGVDVYQPHWYDYMDGGIWCARCTTAVGIRSKFPEIGGAPIVIGEFDAGSDVDAYQRWVDWEAKGYAGAWAWSLNCDRTADKICVDTAALQRFIDTLH